MAVQLPKSTRATSKEVDRRLDVVVAEQEQIFLDRQPRSWQLSQRAVRALAGGVTSSWQITRPQTVWISHGVGSKIYDVDGTEYVDMHGGYGAGLAGHAHPAIVEAVCRRVVRGTHFAQPTEDAIIVAEELGNRFGLPLWRFTNSGTEATMDAVHLMRAITGRDLIIKVEGCYHGHHDSVQISVTPEADDIGPAERPACALSNRSRQDSSNAVHLSHWPGWPSHKASAPWPSSHRSSVMAGSNTLPHKPMVTGMVSRRRHTGQRRR